MSGSPTANENAPVDPIDRFLAVLDNRGKYDTEFGMPRTAGFVVLNRTAVNLAPVVDACLGNERLESLTVRYRVSSGAVFGTVLTALLNDLKNALDTTRRRSISGIFTPALGTPGWNRLLLETPLHSIIESRQAQESGRITYEEIGSVFTTLRDESVLHRGLRLVLFVEVTGADGDENAVAEWNAALSTFLRDLPERTGIVLSGVPQGVEIPTDDPHFLEIEIAGDGGTDDPASTRYADAPLHSDLPTNDDGIGIGVHARALARFVLHAQTRAPLTIGIHGPWGKGKSSFIEMIDRELVLMAPENRATRAQEWLAAENELRTRARQRAIDRASGNASTDASNTAAEIGLRARRDELWRTMEADARRHTVTVRFNAWQFNDATQTWAGLGSVISERLERAIPRRGRLLLRLEYAWKYHRPDVILNVFLPALIVLVSLIMVLLLTDVQALVEKTFTGDKAQDFGGAIGKLLAVLVPAGSLLLAVWALSWRAIGALQPISERVMGYMKRPDHKAQMGYQHRVLDDLRFVHRRVKKHHPLAKVVVYVDDLDRCSDEKIIELLQAVHLVLANCEYFVFLSMDTEMIYRAIRLHYAKSGEELPRNFSENYLRKIIQLSFHLPPTETEKLFELTSRLFSADSVARFELKRSGRTKGTAAAADTADSGTRTDPEDTDTAGTPYDIRSLLPVAIVEELEDTPDELGAFNDFQDYLMDNPRELKRLVNAHRLVKILLQGDGNAWPPTRQRQLVKWLIFCSAWPDLVDDVITESRAYDHDDVLSALVAELEGPVEELDRMARFAELQEPLSSGICLEFEQAARLSQLVTESRAPRRDDA